MKWGRKLIMVEIPATDNFTDKDIVHAVSEALARGDIERSIYKPNGVIGRPRVKSFRRWFAAKSSKGE